MACREWEGTRGEDRGFARKKRLKMESYLAFDNEAPERSQSKRDDREMRDNKGKIQEGKKKECI